MDHRNAPEPAVTGAVGTVEPNPLTMRGYDNLTETVRHGRTQLEGSGVVDTEDPVWVAFAAAGHGMFGISIARRHPGATIVALDWPEVLEVARENAAAAGVGDRHELLPGDAFEVDFGSGYDVVLVTNLYHHFDAAQCEALARKVHACLTPGGRAFTLEFVPNEDRVTPPIPASFALMMLGATVAGDAHPFSVYQEIFRKAGFARNELHRVVPQSPQQLIVSARE